MLNHTTPRVSDVPSQTEDAQAAEPVGCQRGGDSQTPDPIPDTSGTEAYLSKHHYITETWVGIARLRFEQGDPTAAKEALDRCAAEIRELCPSDGPLASPLPVTEDIAAEELRYATRLATILWEKYYKADAPNWSPLDDLMGVLTQIDNMTCDLSRVPTVTEDIAGLVEKAWEAYASKFDHISNQWLDMDVETFFKAGFEAALTSSQAQAEALKTERDEAREDARMRLAQRPYDEAAERILPIIEALLRAPVSDLTMAAETATNEVLEAAFRDTFDADWKAVNDQAEALKAEVERKNKALEQIAAFRMDRDAIDDFDAGKHVAYDVCASIARSALSSENASATQEDGRHE